MGINSTKAFIKENAHSVEVQNLYGVGNGQVVVTGTSPKKEHMKEGVLKDISSVKVVMQISVV